MGLSNWIGKGLLLLPGVRDMARLAIEDYGHNPNLARASTRNGMLDVGFDEPSHRTSDAGEAAEWPDPVFSIDPKGHKLVRVTPPAIIAFAKLGRRIAKLDWATQGGNATRREQISYMIQHTYGWSAMLEYFCWAIADGLRLMQIKTLDKRLNTSKWTLPDLRGGGRLKLRAGGRIHYDGINLYTARTEQGFDIKEPEIIPERDQFMVHRPGAGSSPAGDLDLALALYNLCESWWEGFAADKVYKKRYNQEIYASGRRKMRPGNVQASYQRAAEKVVELQEAGPDGVIVVSDADDVKLRQLHTQGLQDLWHGMDKVAGVIYLMILSSKITSDTSDAGGVGSSSVGLSEELTAALAVAADIADTINADFISWLATRNEALLEPLGEDEEEVFVVPQAPKVSDAGNMDDKKGDQLDEPEDTTGNAPGQDGRTGNPRGPSTANLAAMPEIWTSPRRNHYATLAKPAGMVLPPVHNNCRCSVIEHDDGRSEWVDAQDSRVCPQCRAYGAIFNALVRGDVKLSDEEAEAIQDARDSDKFKKALEYDADTMQQAVTEAAEHDRDGILGQTTKRRGLEPSPDELMERVEGALDASRQAADVQRGITIGTGASAVTVPEAVIAPRITISSSGQLVTVVRPQFIGATITSGRAYNLVWTMRQGGMRAVLVDKLRDRQVATSGNLWWLLLLFAELERRRAEKRREAEIARVGSNGRS